MNRDNWANPTDPADVWRAVPNGSNGHHGEHGELRPPALRRARFANRPSARPDGASAAGDDPKAWTRFLRVHSALILVITLVAGAAAALVATLQTPVYSAHATVVVFPASSYVSASQQAVVMGTEKGIASSQAVLALASDLVDLSPSRLAGGLAVTVPASTDLLDIGFSDADPHLAQAASHAVAAAYVAFRIPATPAATSGSSAPAQTPGAVQPRIITDAALPTHPTSPDVLLDLGVGLLIGLALSTGLAFAREATDDRLRGPADLEANAEVPVLVSLPAVTSRAPERRLVVVHDPQSTAAAAYRDLRTRVVQAAGAREARIILVAGCAREDSSAVAANLAASIALTGRRVSLVCADLRAGSTHTLFGLDNSVGLSSRLSGEAELGAAVRPSTIPGLQLLSAGPPVGDAAEFLQSPELPGLFEALSSQAAFVIVAAPPLLSSPDAGLAAECCDALLLVAEAGRTKRTHVHGAIDQLGALRELLLGCVLDGAGRNRRLTAPAASRSLPVDLPAAPAARATADAFPPLDRTYQGSDAGAPVAAGTRGSIRYLEEEG